MTAFLCSRGICYRNPVLRSTHDHATLLSHGLRERPYTTYYVFKLIHMKIEDIINLLLYQNNTMPFPNKCPCYLVRNVYTDLCNALHTASASSHKETDQILSNNNADFNAYDWEYRTALKVACMKGNIEIVDP